MKDLYPPLHLAFRYHGELPSRISAYLHGRGISDQIIERFIIGWNGERITIPIFDREEKLAFLKLAKDPEDQVGPKMLFPAGVRTELYGWEHLKNEVWQIVICEGEFDRLVLEENGFAAVTSTGGAGVFRPEWPEAFAAAKEIYICFDRDEAGRRGAERVARLIPYAKIVELPEEVGEGGDITDYFVRLKHSREDFIKLLATGKTLPKPDIPASSRWNENHFNNNTSNEVTHLKASVRIENIIGQYCTLRQSGSTYIAPCPFHEDAAPSFVVYPGTQSFHCFGCQAHGDVFTFLMKKDGLTFSEALTVVKSLATS